MFYNDFDNPENNSIIDLEKYKEICKVCDEILLSPDANEVTVAIPILHVIREHPVFLKQYESVFDIPKIKKNKAKFSIEFKIALKFIINLFYKLFFSKKYWHATSILKKNYDYIFVSHLLNVDQAGQNDDFYFGDIPNLLVQKGENVLIVLLNHTGVPNNLLCSKWQHKHVTRVLLTSDIGFFKELKAVFKILFEFKRLNKELKKEKSILKKGILLLAKNQFYPTLDNYRKSQQFLRLAKITSPKNIVTTFEGHGWERIFFSSFREFIPNVKCFAYQHALVFKEQHAIRRNLQKKYNPNTILTSGLCAKNQFFKSNNFSHIDIKILGTNRVPNKNLINKNEINFNRSHNQTILVIPEAINSECILLFEFSINCAKLLPDINFIWRLHPLMDFNKLFNQNPHLLLRPGNIIISKDTLEDDILRSQKVLYRGSTAIINCILSGLKPIYLRIHNEMTIDPLYDAHFYKLIVSCPQDLVQYFLNENLNSKGEEVDQKKLLVYCHNLMSPFDISTLS
jgi:hypothetical protein